MRRARRVGPAHRGRARARLGRIIMTSIAWIGLGKLGLPMARRLVEAGHRVAGYDRDPNRLALGRGAAIATEGGDDLRRYDLVFTSLPDDAALRAATTGDSGLLARMREGAILAETSTVSVEASEV